jgi:hypothetical protein
MKIMPMLLVGAFALRSVSTSVRHVAREFSVDFSLSHLLGLVG